MWVVINSLTCGIVTGVMLLLLILIGEAVNLRAVFVNASPTLYQILSFGYGFETSPLLFVMGGLCGLFAGILYLLSWAIEDAIVSWCVAGAGVLQDMILLTLAAGDAR
jgi:hypothetical protein